MTDPSARSRPTPTGTPLPIGFLGLFVATFAFAAVQTGWISDSEGSRAALAAIALTLPVQLLASILGFLARDTVAGTGMGIVAGAWGAVGLINLTLGDIEPRACDGTKGVARRTSGLVPADVCEGAATGIPGVDPSRQKEFDGMATVSRLVDASPDRVWGTLEDGWSFTSWVVGASHMRAVDLRWPEPGARLHHAAGAWPLLVRDETQVESVDPERTLTLIARGRPIGEARVVIELAPEAGGTRVTMSETPTAGPGKWLDGPPTEALLARRNVESLARLAALVERRTDPE